MELMQPTGGRGPRAAGALKERLSCSFKHDWAKIVRTKRKHGKGFRATVLQTLSFGERGVGVCILRPCRSLPAAAVTGVSEAGMPQSRSESRLRRGLTR